MFSKVRNEGLTMVMSAHRATMMIARYVSFCRRSLFSMVTPFRLSASAPPRGGPTAPPSGRPYWAASTSFCSSPSRTPSVANCERILPERISRMRFVLATASGISSVMRSTPMPFAASSRM